MDGKLDVPTKFDFPFAPYNIQHDFMITLYRVIEDGKLGIFESPTGTGKSLSIICGSIRWLRDHQQRERDKCTCKLNKLQLEKEHYTKMAAQSSDWFQYQSQEIKLSQEINALKIEQDQLKAYENKVADILKKRTDIEIGSNTITIKEEAEEEEEEDLVITEVEDCVEEELEERYKPTKIYICSRTHSQLSQFIGEIIKSPFGTMNNQKLRVASLASRKVYCTNPHVTKLQVNSLMNDKCLDMQDKNQRKTSEPEKKRQKTKQPKSCPFFKQSKIEELRSEALNKILDVEDLVKRGQRLCSCPYYSSRLAAEDAEIILVPYNTILHKSTREANGIQLKNNVIIIDEAHNLLEAMAQMYQTEIKLSQIQECLDHLQMYKKRFLKLFSAATLLNLNQLMFVMRRFEKFFLQDFISSQNEIFTIEHFVCTLEIEKYNMFKLVQFCQSTRLNHKLRTFALRHPKGSEENQPQNSGVKNFLAQIQRKSLPINDTPIVPNEVQSPTNSLLQIVAFLESLAYSYADGRIILHRDSQKISFLLLNPAGNFEDIVREARSVIVTGGTMTPRDEFKKRLFQAAGADPDRIVEFSCGHVVSPNNILPIIISKGPAGENLCFDYGNREKLVKNLGRILMGICQEIHLGGIVVFFPSYKYEQMVYTQIKHMNFRRKLFREPQSSSEVDSVLNKYAETIKKDNRALLFSVVGGKLSEGLNFNDDLGRCIIVVGLPYAHMYAPDLKEKMSYLDKKEGNGAGRQFYENLCMKAVNQSIGRAVRHKNDYATIVLLDERFNRPTIRSALPEWMKTSLKSADFPGALTAIKTVSFSFSFLGRFKRN